MYVFYDKCIMGSSIVNEAIRTIYLFIYFFIKIFCIKETHKLCLNILMHLKSIIKHTSNFHITPRSIIKHTSNFHLDITPRSIKKTIFRLNIFIHLKKHTSNFHLDITSRSMKNKQFLSRDSWCKM